MVFFQEKYLLECEIDEPLHVVEAEHLAAEHAPHFALVVHPLHRLV